MIQHSEHPSHHRLLITTLPVCMLNSLQAPYALWAESALYSFQRHHHCFLNTKRKELPSEMDVTFLLVRHFVPAVALLSPLYKGSEIKINERIFTFQIKSYSLNDEQLVKLNLFDTRQEPNENVMLTTKTSGAKREKQSVTAKPCYHGAKPEIQKINIFCLLHIEGGVCQLFANISISMWPLPRGHSRQAAEAHSTSLQTDPSPPRSRPPMDNH